MNKQIKKILKNNQWFNIYEEEGHVMAMYMASENRTKEMKKAVGTKFLAILLNSKNNYFTMYGIAKDWEAVSKYIFKRIMNKKDWLEKVFKQIDKRGVDLIKFSRSLEKINYQKLSNKRLFELYKKFANKFVAMRLYSSTPMNLEHTTQIFTKYLETELAKYFTKGTENYSSAFSLLTTPHEFSYLRKKDLDLMKLASYYGQKSFAKKLVDFTEKYTWVKYTFLGTPIKKEEFLEEVEELIKDKKWEQKKEQIYAEKQEVTKKQITLVKEYKLTPELIRYFDYARKIVYYKFFRKGIFAESYYRSEFLLREIAQRLHADLDIVRGMLLREVEAALTKGKFSEDYIRERIKSSWLFVYNGQTIQLENDEVKLIKSILDVPEVNYENITELIGQVAMKGEARGIVKIINANEDLNKMNLGDILVSRLTGPNLLPAMKKAAAIVTDTGGLSCHAAIVARELKIPCVVGTNIATKVLKDGDKVEVDANEGIIRII